MRSQAVSFESSLIITPNDIHTTTNSCHILTESHREGQSTCNKSHSMTYTHSTNSSCDEKIKGDEDSGSPDKRHTTVEGNVAPPVAHQVELLTLKAFSSCIRESELVAQQRKRVFIHMEGH